jgi:hypothetical protein
MPGTHIGDKPFKQEINFRNAESSTSIPTGSPVIFVMNTTEDGFAGVLPSTAGAAKSPELFAGVYFGSQSLLATQVGMAQVWGFCNYAIVVQQSRAATTDSFVSAAALSVGQALAIDTVNNAFKTGSQVTGAMTIVTNATTDTVAVNFGDGNPPMAVMAQTLAAAVSSASTTSETRTKITYGLKVFLRAM